MALLLLFAKDAKLFQQGATPGWVTEWLEVRHKRAEKEVAKEKANESEEQAAPPVHAKPSNKRAQARTAKVDEGIKELRLWLTDLVRHGFVNPHVKSYAYWDRMAARMVDAQAASIARRLRQIASIPIQGQPDWAARLLDEVSRLYLLTESYQRIDTLSPDLQEDVRTTIGWSRKKEEVLSLAAVRDQWLVAGQVVEGDDSLRTRRVWLFGERSGQAALILDFAAGRASFEELYMTGQRYDAAVVYYPSAFPQRAMVKQIFAITTPDPSARNLAGYENFDAMLAAYAAALGRNPWLDRIPFLLQRAIVAQRSEGWGLYDAESRMLPVKLASKDFAYLWQLLAQCGGHPATIMGEWDGYGVSLLGAIT